MRADLEKKIAVMVPTEEDWDVVNAIQDANDDREPEEFIEECEQECDWINFGNDLVYNREHAEWIAWRNRRAKIAAYERLYGELSKEEWEAV